MAGIAFQGGGLGGLSPALKKLLGVGGPLAQQGAALSPPPGTYDPAIDAQVGQANRGLGDLLSSYIRDYGEPGTALGGRAGEDYATGKEGIQRGFDYGVADVNKSSGRALTDLLTNRDRAGADYKTGVEGLHRNFAELGAAQTQTARAAGVQRGGALSQALAKRTANEAIARQPMDTGFQRFGQDSQLQQGRIGDDREQALNRLQAGAKTDFAALDRGLLRGTEDAAFQLGTAGRENTQFGLDANAQRLYQANIPLPGPTPVAPASTRPAVPTRRRPTNYPGGSR